MNFRYLFSDFQYILVTGPQRSGTTIAARMIANDTGKGFLPEGAMAVSDKMVEAREGLPRLLKKLRQHNVSTVVQCPIQCRYAHHMASPDTLIVMMRRDIKDIQASEARIMWYDRRQKDLYAFWYKKRKLSDNTPISWVKYNYWDMHQYRRILRDGGNPYNLRYADLEGHSMWLSKTERDGFWPRQISPVEDYTHYKVLI